MTEIRFSEARPQTTSDQLRVTLVLPTEGGFCHFRFIVASGNRRL